MSFLICTRFLSVVLRVVLPKISQTKTWKLSLAKCIVAVAHDEDSHGVQDYRWYGGFCICT